MDELLSYLRANVRYEGGWLYWTTATQGRRAGQRLGSMDRRGYVRAEFNGKKHAVHRLVFLIHNGWLPPVVDHIDGNTSNNRIENLRGCNHSQNICNSRTRRDNSNGLKGVTKADGRFWVACVRFNGRRWAKRFESAEAAAEAARQMRAEMHGQFARG